MSDNILLTVDEVGAIQRKFIWVDYLVFLASLIMCGAIGIYFGFINKQKSAQDYLMGGRNMKLIPVSLSLVASFISGITLLGTPTEIYVFGVQYMYIAGGVIVMAVFLATNFLPVFHDLNLTSAYEYLQLRFDRKVRLFGSVLFTVGILTWLPIVIYVPALAFNQVTGINVHVTTPIVCIVCIFYTSMGGLKAVVWTDVFQTILMFGSMILVIVKGTIDVGGPHVIWQKNWDSGRIERPDFNIDPTVRHTVWALVLGGSFHWLVASGVSQTMIQRYLSLPNLKTAKRSVWCFAVGALSMVGFCSYAGLLIYARYSSCDPLTTQLARAKDQLLPLLVMDVLGVFPGLPGLFVAGVFSAALSSLSTGLNSMAAVGLEDFYKPFTKRELSIKQTDIFLKSIVIVMGVICVGLVFLVEKLGSVLQLSISLSGITNGPQLGIFTMGLLLPWVNSAGALIGGITSMIVMAWISLGAQAAQARGLLAFPEKPVSTHGCDYSFTPKVSMPVYDLHIEQNITMNVENDEVFFMYRISYLWFTFLGCIMSMTVASIVSLAYKPTKLNDVNPKLLAPCIRHILKRHMASHQEPQIVLEGVEDNN